MVSLGSFALRFIASGARQSAGERYCEISTTFIAFDSVNENENCIIILWTECCGCRSLTNTDLNDAAKKADVSNNSRNGFLQKLLGEQSQRSKTAALGALDSMGTKELR